MEFGVIERRITPQAAAKVEFYRHSLGETEKAAVGRVLDSLFLTTGDEVYAFEREFAEHLGVSDVVTVSSCTAALHLSLLGLGVGPGDEVITTAMTFIASATPAFHVGARPVLVDADPLTGNIDPAAVEAAITPATKAIVAVHLYGTMVDVVALRDIADRHGLALIEDAAHCVEGIRDGYRPGQLGDVACFSFYATKTLTCGEGGAIAVRDPELAEQLRIIRLHGMSKNAADRYHGKYEHWDMVALGWKANLTNIQASMLRPQLAHLESRRARRDEISHRYDEILDAIGGVGRPLVPDGVVPARHLYTVWIPGGQRDDVLSSMGAQGVGTAVNYRAIHQLTWMREHLELRFELPHAERIGAETISLPLYDKLTDDEIERVGEALARAIEESR
jgi:UDP-4-amino-4-deoxy-L-arabinose-oxoglutarate aminotransferase